jgi:perosamine synthetase
MPQKMIKPDFKEWTMDNSFIPVCEPLLAGNEKKYILETLETGWISLSGKFINQFEKGFSDYCGTNHGIAVCNGTVALHLALVACGIGKGDEVIIPNFTMIASAFSVCYTGALPVFVDAEKDTWNIDTARIEERITSKTKAIMPVHIYGHPCDMKPIWEIAKRYNLLIIEDAAEAHGAEYDGKKCGGLGHIAAFSFFANKIATTGEGGMVITSDEALATKCRYHKNLCFPLGGSRSYLHQDIGFNYRMSNLHAALGLAQVERIDTYAAMRIHNHALYADCLKDVPGIRLQPERKNVKNVYWMNGVLIDEKEFGVSSGEVMKKLKEEGVETRPFFYGMNRQESLKKYGCACDDQYPVTDELTKNGFYLPSGSSLTESQIVKICELLKRLQA